MKPHYALYILETRWSWDHSNEEFATITIEGGEGYRYREGLEKLLDPTYPHDLKQSDIRDLRAIADAQNQCPMGKNRLVRLYRVAENHSPDSAGWGMRKSTDGNVELHLTLKPICDFDSDDNPVPVRATD